VRVVGKGRHERLMQRLLPITPGVGIDADTLLVIADALAAERVQQLVLREPWLVGDQLYEVARVMRRRLPGLILHARSAGAVEAAKSLGLAVHLHDGEPPPEDVLWGQSCHSVAGAQAAIAAGASYVTLSPAFRSESKPNDDRPTLGVRALGLAQRQLSVPVFALGGVGPVETVSLGAAGVFGVAMIHAIFGSSLSSRAIRERCRMVLLALHYHPHDRESDPID